MRITTLPLIAIATLATAACGSSEPEGPVEQIVVREPGETPAASEAAPEGGETDLLALGETAFAANCVVCHSIDADGASGIGPNLYGVVGRVAGALDNFAYSDAMTGSGITWSAGEIDAYIANPTQKLPGTSMAGVLVTDAEDRSAITAYLGSQSGE